MKNHQVDPRMLTMLEHAQQAYPKLEYQISDDWIVLSVGGDERSQQVLVAGKPEYIGPIENPHYEHFTAYSVVCDVSLVQEHAATINELIPYILLEFNPSLPI